MAVKERAEEDATWSLDSEHSGFEKMESGLNAAAVDYARFGLLFLHGGQWNDAQVVPMSWVDSATAGDATDPAGFYQYSGGSTTSDPIASTRSGTSASTSTWRRTPAS